MLLLLVFDVYTFKRCRILVVILTSAQNVGTFFLYQEYRTLSDAPAAPSASLSQIFPVWRSTLQSSLTLWSCHQWLWRTRTLTWRDLLLTGAALVAIKRGWFTTPDRWDLQMKDKLSSSPVQTAGIKRRRTPEKKISFTSTPPLSLTVPYSIISILTLSKVKLNHLHSTYWLFFWNTL